MRLTESKLTFTTRRFYYGWVIVGLSMISMAFWFGIRTTFSVFFVALIDHFHWTRAEAAGAQSIARVVYMIMAPIIGTLVDRIGPRKVILPGIILTSFGFLLCTQIKTLIQFYLFFGIIVGMGVTCLSIAPFTVILAHWFERKTVVSGRNWANFCFACQYLISTRMPFAFSSFLSSFLAIPLPLNTLLKLSLKIGLFGWRFQIIQMKGSSKSQARSSPIPSSEGSGT
jgi:MFS family permease